MRGKVEENKFIAKVNTNNRIVPNEKVRKYLDLEEGDWVKFSIGGESKETECPECGHEHVVEDEEKIVEMRKAKVIID